MTIVEFRDRHYELVDQLYSSETEKIRFIVNHEEYLYLPTSHTFLKYDAFRGDYYITDNIIRLMTSQTDKGIKELKNMLQNEKRRKMKLQE